MLLNHQLPSHQRQHQATLEELYLNQRQKQDHESIGILGPSLLPNHQPPPVPRASDLQPLSRGNQQAEQPSYMSRSLPDRSVQHHQNLATSVDTRHQPQPYGIPSENNVEKIQHSYDTFGRPLRPQDESSGERERLPEENEHADPDGWDFDDPPQPMPTDEAAPPDYPPPQRPDTDAFPSANMSLKSPTRGPGSHRRKNSLSSKRKPSDGSHEVRELSSSGGSGSMRENTEFKIRFALRGHLDVVRSVIFTGGGSPSEPELCTCGDDGVIKRWVIPAGYGTLGSHMSNDLDVTSYFTHRGHSGAVLSLAASPASQTFSNGGRAQGDGWVFSGGQDATVRVWERGRVDPKATLDGHTDAVWTVCVLPGTSASTLGDQSMKHGGHDRIILASGAADGTILIWSVSTPPQLASPHTTGSRRGGRRANSVSSGSNFPSSPQPSVATTRPFHHSLVHRIERVGAPSPTCISPLSASGDSFVVSFADASVLAYNTRTAEEIIGMASMETYDGTPATGVNAVVATAVGMDGNVTTLDTGRGPGEDDGMMMHSATGGGRGSLEGMVLSGHEDQFIRFFDANSGMLFYPSLFFSLSPLLPFSLHIRYGRLLLTLMIPAGQNTYSMLAHPSAISSLSLSPDGQSLVSAGHDTSLRFWSLEKRTCIQDITSHRIMRGEGVCSVVWSQDGRWVVSGGGDGAVKVFAR